MQTRRKISGAWHAASGVASEWCGDAAYDAISALPRAERRMPPANRAGVLRATVNRRYSRPNRCC